MSVVEKIHGGYVHGRRVRVLAGHLAPLLPPSARVLDVGCGDGQIDHLILQQRSDVSIQGLEFQPRADAHIPVQAFDGKAIPFPDRSFDVVLFVDVLHHTDDPMILLREAARVSRRVVLKDHFRQGLLANATLRFMDRVGNLRHGVSLPHNYWSPTQWREAFDQLKLQTVTTHEKLGLYPWLASMLFERSLHFIAVLKISEQQS